MRVTLVSLVLTSLLVNGMQLPPDGAAHQQQQTQHAQLLVPAPAVRGGAAPSRQRTGSGLGLPIVQQIAVTHGGRIQASNGPGGGALLELILPAQPPDLQVSSLSRQ